MSGLGYYKDIYACSQLGHGTRQPRAGSSGVVPETEPAHTPTAEGRTIAQTRAATVEAAVAGNCCIDCDGNTIAAAAVADTSEASLDGEAAETVLGSQAGPTNGVVKAALLCTCLPPQQMLPLRMACRTPLVQRDPVLPLVLRSHVAMEVGAMRRRGHFASS